MIDGGGRLWLQWEEARDVERLCRYFAKRGAWKGDPYASRKASSRRSISSGVL
jgi:hypothetical protein